MRLIFILSLLLVFSASYCQVKADSIEIKKSFGTVFRQYGKVLAPKQLLKITESNPEAYKEMKLAKTNYDVGFAVGFAGGFLIGWPVGVSIGGGNVNWGLAAIGGALVAASIPFSSAYTKHTKRAALLYNSGLRQTGNKGMDIKLGLTANGIGFKLRF
jgi:hypothetical protein